ncbi:MAG: carboxypeptidase regulatory-like domain-containing protein, partial [Lachnospiraceae bacterium]|nr:carboxypeptidase regulatory-like domain-containing protein [Lachnospiraceae bacterium]
ISGRAVDESGEGIEDVAVVVRDTDENTVQYLSTDAEGRWQTADYTVVEGHTYAVSYSKTDYEFADAATTVVAQAGDNDVGEALGVAIAAGDEVGRG